MRVDEEIIVQIKQTADELDLLEYTIEKDFYLTHVIGILSEVADENFCYRTHLRPLQVTKNPIWNFNAII